MATAPTCDDPASNEYPESTRTIHAWRLHMALPAVVQNLKDIGSQTVQWLRDKNVPESAIEGVIKALEQIRDYPLSTHLAEPEIQRALTKLLDGVQGIDSLARRSLLPGDLVKAVVCTSGQLFYETGVVPAQIPQDPGRPRSTFMLRFAGQVVDALRGHRGVKPYYLATQILDHLGWPEVRVDSLKRELRRFRRQLKADKTR